MECQNCGWPVCSRECQNNTIHKHECELTVARGDKVSFVYSFNIKENPF